MNRAVSTVTTAIVTATVVSGCSIFGGDGDERDEVCMEPQPYQAERLQAPIEAPDGLDQLDIFKEMPIPKAETPPRPADAGCVTKPPSVRSE